MKTEKDSNPNVLLNEYDKMLDDTYGLVTVAGHEYPTSRVLFFINHTAYLHGFADYIESREEKGN